jgi:hypothetical protein
MNLHRVRLLSVVLPVLGAVACGDDGATSASGTTSATVTATNTTPSGPTSDPTSETTPTGDATDVTMGGSMSMSEGQTTEATTGPGPTTTTVDVTSTGPVTLTSSGSTGTTEGADATAAGTSTTTGGDDTTTTDPSTTTTGQPCMPGDTMGMGDVEKSYLWVANSDEGTVSKVNTQTLIEEGRYRTGPLGGGYAENPSRTAVSLDGRFVVVNGRQSGASTVIAANLEDCDDKNNNGMIDTSQNKNDIRPWGQDECMKWTINHPKCAGIGCGPRGVTWTPGTFNQDTCQFDDPKIWVGYLPQNGFGVAHMARLDGLTGTLEETVIINNWSQGWTDYGPYGAALDKNQNVWFTGLRGELFRINTANNPATFDRWLPPFGTESYGMTVDPDGDPWMAGCSGPVTTFDPDTNTFTAVPGTNACYRGIAADKDGGMWVASNGTCGVMQIDHVTNTVIQFHNFPQCLTPVGVSTDLEGFVWVVDENLGAWKIDPMAPNNKQLVNITGDHYTYSDMTGGQLKSVILPQ